MTPPEQRSAGVATEVEPDPTPGRRLREAREAANLSLAEVASQLHLERRAVELLERDEYDKLHAPAFVRGYLSSYARLLHLPARPVVEAYDRRGFGPPALVPDIAQRPQVRVGDLPVRVVTYLIAGMLVVLVVLWWQSRQAPLEEGPFAGDVAGEAADGPSGTTDLAAARPAAEVYEPGSPGAEPAPVPGAPPARRPAPTPAAHPGPSTAPTPGGGQSPRAQGETPAAVVAAATPDVEAPARPLPDAGESDTAPPTETTAPPPESASAGSPSRPPDLASARAAPATRSEPAADPTGPEARMTAAAASREAQASAPQTVERMTPVDGDDVLRMDFSRPSWVEVYDRNGGRLYYSLAKEGSEILIRGAGPMRVLLGDVEGANVVYNGEPFELAVHAGRKVARFVVGEGTPAPARRPPPPSEGASESEAEPAGPEPPAPDVRHEDGTGALRAPATQ